MTTGADIQIENGNWSQIHNAIWEALAKAPLTGEQFRCLMFLFRQTYGSQQKKKEDRISLAQFEAATGIRRQNVWRALHQLIDHGVLKMQTNGPKRAATWGFNKYVEQWNFDSVIPDDDSSVIPDDYRQEPSVIIGDDSEGATCNHGGLQSVITPHESTQEEEKAEAEAAAADSTPPPPALEPLFAAFVQDFQSIWGLMVASDYVKAEIIEWTARVTPDGWRYALKEAADHNARNWKYLRRILSRIEQDGFAVSFTPAMNTTAFALEDISS